MIARLLCTGFVRGKLVVEGRSHDVLAELLVLVEFHDRAALIVIVRFAPTVMLFLPAFVILPIAWVLRSIQDLARFQGDGPEGIAFLVGLEEVGIAECIIHSDGELSALKEIVVNSRETGQMLIHN